MFGGTQSKRLLKSAMLTLFAHFCKIWMKNCKNSWNEHSFASWQDIVHNVIYHLCSFSLFFWIHTSKNLFSPDFSGAGATYLCQSAFRNKPKNALLPHFSSIFQQNLEKMWNKQEKAYFKQWLMCAAPKCWSKYTTIVLGNYILHFYIFTFAADSACQRIAI